MIKKLIAFSAAVALSGNAMAVDMTAVPNPYDLVTTSTANSFLTVTVYFSGTLNNMGALLGNQTIGGVLINNTCTGTQTNSCQFTWRTASGRGSGAATVTVTATGATPLVVSLSRTYQEP